MTTVQEDPVATYLKKLNGKAWGVALGLICGFGLMVATLFLVLKGGENVGQHLGLLGNYFPGYDVNFVGAFIGFAYAFFVGFVIGRSICFFYNLAARF